MNIVWLILGKHFLENCQVASERFQIQWVSSQKLDKTMMYFCITDLTAEKPNQMFFTSAFFHFTSHIHSFLSSESKVIFLNCDCTNKNTIASNICLKITKILQNVALSWQKKSFWGPTPVNWICVRWVECVDSIKFPGLHITLDLTWSLNTFVLMTKAQQRTFFLRKLKRVDSPFSCSRTCDGEHPLPQHDGVVRPLHSPGQKTRTGWWKLPGWLADDS